MIFLLKDTPISASLFGFFVRKSSFVEGIALYRGFWLAKTAIIRFGLDFFN